MRYEILVYLNYLGILIFEVRIEYDILRYIGLMR